LEDLARFVLDDADLVADLKRIRHGITTITSNWPGGSTIAARDTRGDVGTDLSTPQETARPDLVSVAAAAARRATEAMRSLEELAKVETTVNARRIEAWRYETYDLGARVELGVKPRQTPQWRLCLLLTESTCHQPVMDVLQAAIDGGVDCVQVREKSMSTANLLERAASVIAVARPAGVAVVINDRVDVALASGADGVQLGDSDMPVAAARAMAGPDLLIGVTVRTTEAIRAAIASGGSNFGLGPMFASTTKPDLPARGPDHLRMLLPVLEGRPHLAIGGVTPANIDQVVAAGGRGVAVCESIAAMADPASAARALIDRLDVGPNTASHPPTEAIGA
jgi:thiamine-phosphate pyrophosphorylase